MPDEFGNFLGIYEPFKAEQLKALMPHPGGGSTYAPSYASWGEWDRDLRGAAFMGTRTDYSAKVGDPRASSLIMAGVRWAGSTLPEAPLLLKQSDGTKGESEVIPNHPLVKLWRRPNPYYSGSTLMKAFAFSWITKGDVYIRKVWNDSRTKVVELWYEPHWLIRPRWIGDGQSAYIAGEMDSPDKFITYYELDRGAKKYRLETSDVIHFRDGLNAETRCGQNGIAAILREVFGDNEAANYFAQLMANGGVPKFILSADPELELDADTQKRVAAEAQRQSEGDNRGKVMVLSGVKPFKLPWSPEEMDMRASRFMSEDRFAAVTGIPAVEMELGAGRESSIYNNVRQASERATERFLVPAWNHIAEELTVQLLPDFDESETLYVTHDLSKVRALAEDDTAHSERVVKEYQGGIITLNEARSMRNMEPIEGGDIFKETQPRMEGEAGLGQASQARGGASYAVGDWVKVMAGKEHDAMTKGAVGQIVEVSTAALGIKFKGMPQIHRWYVAAEVEAAQAGEGGEMPATMKSLPEEGEIDEAVSWFDAVAPPAARGILDASVNGNA